MVFPKELSDKIGVQIYRPFNTTHAKLYAQDLLQTWQAKTAFENWPHAKLGSDE